MTGPSGEEPAPTDQEAASSGATREPDSSPSPSPEAEAAEAPEAAEPSGTPDTPAPVDQPSAPATGVRWADAPEPDSPAAYPAVDDPTPAAGFSAPGWTTPSSQPPPPQAPSSQPPPSQPAPSPSVPARRRRVRLVVAGIVLGVVVVALVVVALLAFLVGPRFARYDVLDRAAVERGVTDVVARDWKRKIDGVACPEEERVRPGASFVCSGTVDGKQARIPVNIVDESGAYEVGQPR